MDVSSAAPQVATAIQVALQKKQLDQMKLQGASTAALISSAPSGSVNSASQGTYIDAQA